MVLAIRGPKRKKGNWEDEGFNKRTQKGERLSLVGLNSHLILLDII